jgi:SNF2 family DNA or RNA helicase
MFDPKTILSGQFWPEKVRVITSDQMSQDLVKIEAVGTKTKEFYERIISSADIDKITIEDEILTKFDGDGEKFFLYVESNRIRNAQQYDPLYAVNVSQVDALPHQIDAVYYHVLSQPSIRFLIADDPGAGKTIMAGLIIKELKYRGLLKRILIVCPGHLAPQWIREMKEKFQENFQRINRASFDADWGQNPFNVRDQVVTSIDFAKQEDIINSLDSTNWDLIIVDEAHKMSAYQYGDKISKTIRYQLGETLSETSTFLLFLTATPHRGDVDNFRLFLDLLRPGFFADRKMLEESLAQKDNPLFVRRMKEDMKNFDNQPLFPPRHVITKKFKLSDTEKVLYNAVTRYVQEHFNKALAKDKRNITFAMTILQRRLASSIRAIHKSLARRKKRLQDLYERAELYEAGEISFDEEFLEDIEEQERWQREEEILQRLTMADNKEELKLEIDVLGNLVELAKNAEKTGDESKLMEMKEVIKAELIDGERKLLIFTESKDTLEYLVERIHKWGYTTCEIHGGMKMDDRINSEHRFRNEVQICVATEAAGEGINLQFCSLMVNYDIPWNPNRLEQRMGRIHRYGQREEVYIYNLVSKDTMEGRILTTLFEKLERMKEAMGSDRVFDVIGDVIGTNRKLKDLIMEAVSSQRSMDEILEGFVSEPDEEAISRVKEAALESLASKHIDLYKILGEQRKAKEERLVPEFVEGFFERTAIQYDIKMDRRKDKFWTIGPVPFELRNRDDEFKHQYGEVFSKYTKIGFDKEEAFDKSAEFVAMGHPLLETVIEQNLSTCEESAHRGAVFTDPDGDLNGLIWIASAEITDGNNKVAGRRLFGVYQDHTNRLSFIHPGILWDLKPEPSGTRAQLDLDLNFQKVESFLIENSLQEYKNEIQSQREINAEIKRKYGVRSLEQLIGESEAKLADYATKRALGENVVPATEQREQKKRDTHDGRLKKLKREIEAEIALLPSSVNLIGAAKVLAETSISVDRQRSNKEIEMVGMRLATDYENNRGWQPTDVSAEKGRGFDIESTDGKGNYRYIEVKARAGEGSVDLTNNEWLKANRLREEYWLYVVTNAGTDSPKLSIIQDPAKYFEPERVETVRWRIDDWQTNAEAIA